ncbi:hypothetical protein OC845_005780 [Tilletia horrida]|nr:hypothetical protein OC845_005780 [Tilletia horrida]
MLVLSQVKSWTVQFALGSVLVQVVHSAVASQLNVDLPARSLLLPRAGSVSPNQDCDSDADCASGSCNLRADLVCDRLHPDGSPVEDCFGDYYPASYNYCEGYPLGHKCANQGECQNGVCSAKGYCVSSYVGQACKDNLGCSGAQLCKSGKCFLPANSSINPLQDCKRGYSCKSGSCVTFTDNLILNDGSLFTLPLCDYLHPGQRGCNSTTDCGGYVCSNGTCKIGKDGDRCLANFQCLNLCSLEGVCYSPDLSKPPVGGPAIGQPCKNDSQCLSGVCRQPVAALTRPDFTNPGQNFTYTRDRSCQGQLFGGKCFTTDDCEEGHCINGACTGLALNSTCTDDKACASSTCNIAKGKTKGKCVISKRYASCSSNSNCYSNDCGNAYCFATFCPQPNCAAVGLSGKCRFRGDCLPYLYCRNGTCRD